MTGGAGECAPLFNIVGTAVALGPLRRDLISSYARWYNDFTVTRTLMQERPPIALTEQERRYEAWVTDPDSARFTIYARDAARPVGIVRLGTLDFRNRSTGFGIIIGEAGARGRGYGTEATALALDYAFTALGLHSVSLGVAAFNAAGIRAYTKAGFKECGRRRECWWLAGRWWDEVLMDCLASEFTSPVLAGIFRPDEPREG